MFSPGPSSSPTVRGCFTCVHLVQLEVPLNLWFAVYLCYAVERGTLEQTAAAGWCRVVLLCFVDDREGKEVTSPTPTAAVHKMSKTVVQNTTIQYALKTFPRMK